MAKARLGIYVKDHFLTFVILATCAIFLGTLRIFTTKMEYNVINDVMTHC